MGFFSHRVCLPILIVVFIALALFPGCRKPNVEVEEGVVPLPPGPGRVTTTAGAESAAVTAAKALPLTLEQACGLMDKHLESYGVSVEGRRCGHDT